MRTSQTVTKKRSFHYQKRLIWKPKKIAKILNIDNKMNITTKRQCFGTIKDHKVRVYPKYRFLNLTKCELGKISNHILQQISTNTRTELNVNQW